MPIQIFVEDELNEPYEIIARKALRLPASIPNRKQVKVSLIKLGELTSSIEMLNLVAGAFETGYTCVVFIMDHENPLNSADRPRKLTAFRDAFDELCRRLQELPSSNALKTVNVIKIVTLNCLECWLASDPQAIVDAVRGNRGVRYSPETRNTENLTPNQAATLIADHIRQVGRLTNRQDLLQATSGNIKRRGKMIANQLDISRCRNNNRSLSYFVDMVSCERSGCETPCPEHN